MNNKQQILIVIINIFSIVILFIIAELAVYYTDKKFNHEYKGNEYPPFILFKNEPSLDNYNKIFRKPVGLENNKAPVFLYGCSFAYGGSLEENERPDYILSELTQRPVYNYSVYAEGMLQALYIMQNQEKITPAPEYVIYMFQSDHIRRLYSTCDIYRTDKFLHYKIVNDKIIFDMNRPHFIENTYIFRKILQTVLPPLSNYFSTDSAYKRFKIFVQNMNTEIHEKYPDTKFIFVFFDNNPNCIKRKNLEDFKKLENSKFKIIYFPDIFDASFYHNPENRIWDGFHPSGRAWKIVIPEIVKRM